MPKAPVRSETPFDPALRLALCVAAIALSVISVTVATDPRPPAAIAVGFALAAALWRSDSDCHFLREEEDA